MRCVAMRLADWLDNKAHLWCSVEFTQPFIQRRRRISEAHTPWLKGMAIWRGQRFWKTAEIIRQKLSMQQEGSKRQPSSLPAGISSHAIDTCGLPYRPSEGVPSTALSVLYGEPMVTSSHPQRRRGHSGTPALAAPGISICLA